MLNVETRRHMPPHQIEAALERILPRISNPARYSGNEWNVIVKDWETTPIRVAMAYPEVYEVAMSNGGVAMLYDILNREADMLCERVHTPWIDMLGEMRRLGVPAFSLETKHAMADFDIVGFALAYELNYTNILATLDLAGIPLLASERSDSDPIILGGGGGSLSPEPLADFIDLFLLGDAEESIVEVARAQHAFKQAHPGASRKELLHHLAQIEGVYVPAFYEFSYNEDGTIADFKPIVPGVPLRPKRRILLDLKTPPLKPLVPLAGSIHDRATVEIMRGCTRGCRFCQIGMITRPLRQRPKDEILQAIDRLLENTGYEEVSLSSLSTGDYAEIEPLVNELVERHPDVRISLSSLRSDSFGMGLTNAVRKRNNSVTFAPEAGSQRMRDVMNKGLTEEDILNAAKTAFEGGHTTIKCYFMIGLPTETMEDVYGIVDLVQKIERIGRQIVGKRVKVNLTISTFVPKPHTPFQWFPQDDPATLRAKHDLLRKHLYGKIHLNWHDVETSILEAAFARGDRRIGQVLLRVYQLGAIFDGWNEFLDWNRWMQAFKDCNLDVHFYAHRHIPITEILPWDHIDTGLTKTFMIKEYKRSIEEELTADCRDHNCTGCGLRINSCPRLEEIVSFKHLKPIAPVGSA